MTSLPCSFTIECPKCGTLYEDRYRPAADLAPDHLEESGPPPARPSICPSCGFRLRHGATVVREEDGVWIVEADGEVMK